MTLSAQSKPVASSTDNASNHCFGCGAGNPHGMHLDFTLGTTDAEHPIATCEASFDHSFEGPPGYLHGGLIATVLDEAMSKLNKPLGVVGVTRSMQVDYLRPVPLGTPLVITGRHLRREGRKLYHQAVVTRIDGTVLAEAQGLFIVIEERARQA